MSKKTKWIFGIAAGAVFFALAAWFWSLGAVASEDVPAIRVEARQPGVELKRQGSDDWRKVEVAAELMAGDAVRTDREGLAEVRWGDLGVTRLDASSELKIEVLPPDITDAVKASIRLHLASGRAWSRLLKLYGPESSFETRTDSVVATVRGTAFGLAKGASSTRLAVTEAVVEAQPTAGGLSTWVKQGKKAEFDAFGNTSGVGAIPGDDAWVNGNRRLDEEFDKAFRAELTERFKKLQKPAPEWLVEMSEGWHLRFASGDKRVKLDTVYTKRRLAYVALGGDKVCLDGELPCGRLDYSKHPESRGKLLGELRNVIFLLGGKIRVTDGMLWGYLSSIRRSWLGSDRVGEKFNSMLAIWDDDPGAAQDDEVLRKKLLGLTEALDGDVKVLSAGLSEGASVEMSKGVNGLYVMLREEGEGTVGTASSTASVTETSTSTAPTSGQPTRQPALDGGKSSEINPTTQAAGQSTTAGPCSYSSLTLMVKPTSNVDIGSPVSLTLLGACQDGRVDDLTPKATFNPGAAGDGRVVGNVFYPARGGEIFLYGNYFSDGKTRIAQAAVSVKQAVIGRRPIGLDVTPLGPTTVATGKSSPIQAMATYDDKTTMDVTSRCSWTSTEPRLADVFSGRVQAMSETGKVTITCTFSENGSSVSDGQAYEIILDPALLPTGGVRPIPGQYYMLN